MDIHVIDGFYNCTNLNEAIESSFFYDWAFNRQDLTDEIYWTVHVHGVAYNLSYTIKDDFNKFKKIQILWNYFSNKFNVPIENLDSCYLNGITHGLEAYPHHDAPSDGHTTVILYLCENWNVYWGGETAFFDKEFVKNNPAHDVFYSADIIKSVLPKYNRMVLFDSHIMHAVRPISKSFKGLRKTLMFKLKNISVQKVMENYKCN